jgi:hypothetical protein
MADLSGNSAICHHCRNLPAKLANCEPLKLRPITEQIGNGAYGPTIQATMRPGFVTTINLVGRKDAIRIAAMEGEVAPYELEFPGSAGKVVFPFDLAQALE